MIINKAENGSNNLCGSSVAALRIKRGLSQRQLADMLQLEGLEIDKNAIQRIEAGKRFVTDLELVKLAKVFAVDYQDLIGLPR